MRKATRWMLVLAVVCAAVGSDPALRAQQPAAARVAIDADDIGGVVRSAAGPEAGVWVIAETADLPTKMRRIVVTYPMPSVAAASDLPFGTDSIEARITSVA